MRAIESNGWSLHRIHDLETLVQEAIARDGDFAPYLEHCQEITGFYIETRYPIGLSSPIPGSALGQYLATTERLIALVLAKT